jgi:hypothetical protein
MPHRGDLIEVHWVDIYEDATGDPDLACLSRRASFGVYWQERDDSGIPVLVTTTTTDKDGSQQQGFCCYPKACVLDVKVVRRARGRRRESATK